MPARSRQQQKWAFATKGPKWAKAHHFDELAPGAPKKVKAKKKPKAKRKAKPRKRKT